MLGGILIIPSSRSTVQCSRRVLWSISLTSCLPVFLPFISAIQFFEEYKLKVFLSLYSVRRLLFTDAKGFWPPSMVGCIISLGFWRFVLCFVFLLFYRVNLNTIALTSCHFLPLDSCLFRCPRFTFVANVEPELLFSLEHERVSNRGRFGECV